MKNFKFAILLSGLILCTSNSNTKSISLRDISINGALGITGLGASSYALIKYLYSAKEKHKMIKGKKTPPPEYLHRDNYNFEKINQDMKNDLYKCIPACLLGLNSYQLMKTDYICSIFILFVQNILKNSIGWGFRK